MLTLIFIGGIQKSPQAGGSSLTAGAGHNVEADTPSAIAIGCQVYARAAFWAQIVDDIPAMTHVPSGLLLAACVKEVWTGTL